MRVAAASHGASQGRNRSTTTRRPDFRPLVQVSLILTPRRTVSLKHPCERPLMQGQRRFAVRGVILRMAREVVRKSQGRIHVCDMRWRFKRCVLQRRRWCFIMEKMIKFFPRKTLVLVIWWRTRNKFIIPLECGSSL